MIWEDESDSEMATRLFGRERKMECIREGFFRALAWATLIAGGAFMAYREMVIWGKP